MPTVAVYNMQGEQVGSIELSETVFGGEVNEAAMHQVLVVQAANRRQGTASTRTRGEVRGGGRKPWRQKGTGRARAGSTRSPLWRGGGTVFGPRPRDYRQVVPRALRRTALRSALAAKLRDGELLVLEKLALAEVKTRNMASMLKAVGADQSALIVMAEPDKRLSLSTRNIPGVATIPARELNLYEVLGHRHLILTREAVDQVEEVLG
ncbi:MAG: 50S ribosomal protein L4 [Clostridia bacterium]|nr:MAG: 50S ribosomal protein L4 [Clostridia bacterium]